MREVPAAIIYSVFVAWLGFILAGVFVLVALALFGVTFSPTTLTLAAFATLVLVLAYGMASQDREVRRLTAALEEIHSCLDSDDG